MLTAQLETEIHTLSRQEKYHLIQVLVRDLESEEPQFREQGLQRPKISRSERKDVSTKAHAIDTFLKKWKGSLKGVDADAAKHQYLQEKYQ
jgi:hypothetical protein